MMFMSLRVRASFPIMIFVLFLSLSFIGSSVFGLPAKAYILGVPYHSQINGYYCGPASLEMVFDYYGPDVPQPEIADVARTSGTGTYTFDMVRAAHFSNLSTSVGREMLGQNITGYTARKMGYAAFEHWGMTMDELKSVIAAGYPVIVLTTWHFRVAVGYDNKYITFQDSYYGEMYNLTYSVFDADWDYSSHWGLLVSPWNVEVSAPKNVSIGDVFTVTATISYPAPPPFPTDQYPASETNATIKLLTGLSLVSGETATKTIGTGDLAAGASANVTWTVQAGSLGNYAISVKAEGKIAGFVPPLTPYYPSGYNYTDRIGGSGQSVLAVIDATQPRAEAGLNQTVNEDTLVTFDGSGSWDNVGIASFIWTFFDGTQRSLTGPNPTYTFKNPGTYTIALFVADDAGKWSADTVVITVLDVTKPVANAGRNQTVRAGETVTFDAGNSTDNVGIISYEWDFGDNTTGTEIVPLSKHVYSKPGTYTVTLTVRDAAGNTGTHSITVMVLPDENYLLWIVGAVASVVGLAVAGSFLWRRQKTTHSH